MATSRHNEGSLPAADIGISQGDDRRLKARLELGRPGTVRLDDDGPIDAIIVDLTRDGCRIETDATLLPGTMLNIGIAHVGRVEARVVWRAAEGYGCAFPAPLPPGAVTAAFGGSNVATFPRRDRPAASQASLGKVPPYVRLALVVGGSGLCWSVIGLGASLLR